jgi:hypothetical protein
LLGQDNSIFLNGTLCTRFHVYAAKDSLYHHSNICLLDIDYMIDTPGHSIARLSTSSNFFQIYVRLGIAQNPLSISHGHRTCKIQTLSSCISLHYKSNNLLCESDEKRYQRLLDIDLLHMRSNFVLQMH